MKARLLEGRRALVTGASRGIGRTIATDFASMGAVVGINYIHSREEAEEVLSIVEVSTEGILLQGDISVENDAKDVVDRFIDAFGGLDILVNNAGIYLRKDIDRASIEDYDRTMAVNVRSAFMMSKYALPFLRSSEHGRIINLSSQLAFKGSTHGTAYVTSKAAMIGLTRALALELAGDGITVNAIAPGTIDTDIISSYSEKQREERAKEIPVKRLGTPSDISNAAIYLASDMGSYVNGEILGVNGGSALH